MKYLMIKINFLEILYSILEIHLFKKKFCKSKIRDTKY